MSKQYRYFTEIVCKECNQSATVKRRGRNTPVFCSRTCASTWSNRTRFAGYIPKPRKMAEVACVWCKGIFQAAYYERTKRKFCSHKCAAYWRGQQPTVKASMRRNALAMGKRNIGRKRPDHSQRMKEQNPSHCPAVIAKARATKERNGTLHVWPGERGGNGRLTRQQVRLRNALGPPWCYEMVIPTKQPRVKGGYPPAYKVDIGHRALQIAIEVDGDGHKSEKAKGADLKKDRMLSGLQWIVLRFSNREIDEDLEGVLQKIRLCTASR